MLVLTLVGALQHFGRAMTSRWAIIIVIIVIIIIIVVIVVVVVIRIGHQDLVVFQEVCEVEWLVELGAA